MEKQASNLQQQRVGRVSGDQQPRSPVSKTPPTFTMSQSECEQPALSEPKPNDAIYEKTHLVGTTSENEIPVTSMEPEEDVDLPSVKNLRSLFNKDLDEGTSVRRVRIC